MHQQTRRVGIFHQAGGWQSHAIGIVNHPIVVQIVGFAVVVFVHILDGNDHSLPRSNPIRVGGNFG